ncbi:uncharacterized protein DFL_003996 [Arthrobotrys flagrans]|uniref:Uncharacterized protein n=1 Tax=Arthrobotrys flagrans TaxID=97331 RepID=A0A437A3G2_ARTFL|nr:hypothetical protein DFL_003996 [Arthrobotrys flagrans]
MAMGRPVSRIRRLPTALYGKPRGPIVRKIHDATSDDDEIHDILAKYAIANAQWTDINGRWTDLIGNWTNLKGQWTAIKWVMGVFTSAIVAHIFFDISVKTQVTALDERVAAIEVDIKELRKEMKADMAGLKKEIISLLESWKK